MNSDTLCNPRVSQVPCKYAQHYYIGLCHQFYTVSTGFKCVSQTPSRSLCLCGSVSMVLLLDICRNSVSRSKTSEGVHGYGLHLLDVFSYRGWGRQRDSEVLHSMGRQFGTVCHQLCETAVCLRERSRGSYRPISSVVDNNEHHPALLGRFVIVASSINVQTYLHTYNLYVKHVNS